MNRLKLSVTLTILCTVASAQQQIAAITLDDAIDTADLIATGELIDLAPIDSLGPPNEIDIVSINTAERVRWEANFKIDTVLKGSFEPNDTIRVVGLEYPMAIDRPKGINQLPKTGSIWFLARAARGAFGVVHGDMVLEDTDARRVEIDFYLRSRDGLNQLFTARTPTEVRDATGSGVDVNAQDYFGDTAMHWAVEHDRIDVVRALLDAGAKVDLKVINALDVAIDLRRTPIIALLRSRGAQAHGLFLIQGKPLRDYEDYLAEGADVNAGMSDGYSPLTRLLGLYEPNANAKISWLLDHGAITSFPNGSRTQPLIQAVYCRDSTELAELLLQHGALVNATDERGWTPLTAALVCNTTFEMVAFLVSNGADASIVDAYGWTSLVRYLVGNTASASVDIVQLLLESGADPNAVVASRGESALDIVTRCSRGRENCRMIARLLNEHGAQTMVEPTR